MSTTSLAAPQRRPVQRSWGLAIAIAAVLAIAIALWVGIRGLTENPVKGTDAAGVTTISGSFEPLTCGSHCVEGYVQAGARSVFVIFPPECSPPARGSAITAYGKRDTTQGNATYRSASCP